MSEEGIEADAEAAPDDKNASLEAAGGSEPAAVNPSSPTQSSEGASTVSDGASPNPLGEQLDFSLSVPPIEVRMVNAAALEDYEIWFLMSSIVGSAAIGFLVAFIQSFHEDIRGNTHSDTTLLVVCLVFTLLLVLSAARAIILRRRITSQSKTYSMKASASSVAKLDNQPLP
jgi:hypothetical protein